MVGTQAGGGGLLRRRLLEKSSRWATASGRATASEAAAVPRTRASTVGRSRARGTETPPASISACKAAEDGYNAPRAWWKRWNPLLVTPPDPTRPLGAGAPARSSVASPCRCPRVSPIHDAAAHSQRIFPWSRHRSFPFWWSRWPRCLPPAPGGRSRCARQPRGSPRLRASTAVVHMHSMPMPHKETSIGRVSMSARPVPWKRQAVRAAVVADASRSDP